ncbi:MAG TPA: hypothetical protein VFT74_10130 [Isosphaeraceae bacterium]|nr:hypothetical protein [Isosphaeraceae bacterium]
MKPLLMFSCYTEIQRQIVEELGREILASLDAIISSEGGAVQIRDAIAVHQTYGRFWLWVLGAYEIVRTMCSPEGRTCFTPGVATELEILKRRLSILRMPFAKQQLRRKHEPVSAEPSISSFSASPPDLRFEAEGEGHSARELIVEFERVFASITKADVLRDFRTSYPSRKPSA